MQASENETARTFGRIIFASDFSEAAQAAFPVALRVCTAFKASLSILHVFEYPKAIASERRGQILELDSLKKVALISLERLRTTAKQEGVTCETTMSTGIPSLTILKALSHNKYDLVILGTSDPHGFERIVFGSTAETVLREASCPVLTVGPHVTDQAMQDECKSPVLFATDFDHTTTHAIRYAGVFCKATQSPLHCLHVLPETLESGTPSQIVPQIMTEALHHVAIEKSSADPPAIYSVTYGNDVAKAISEYARQHRAWLIVLGIQRASILASHVPDHIAYRIITESPCSVLTIAYASKLHPHQATCL
ncbi:universal stress protein [Edaphobacter paludis]|uniref:Universal stress protein n=1 Tax=Edaphobacter paludis TaxID=3035702 RepID=A0AAU7D201_9BACT